MPDGSRHPFNHLLTRSFIGDAVHPDNVGSVYPFKIEISEEQREVVVVPEELVQSLDDHRVFIDDVIDRQDARGRQLRILIYNPDPVSKLVS